MEWMANLAPTAWVYASLSLVRPEQSLILFSVMTQLSYCALNTTSYLTTLLDHSAYYPVILVKRYLAEDPFLNDVIVAISESYLLLGVRLGEE